MRLFSMTDWSPCKHCHLWIWRQWLRPSGRSRSAPDCSSCPDWRCGLVGPCWLMPTASHLRRRQQHSAVTSAHLNLKITPCPSHPCSFFISCCVTFDLSSYPWLWVRTPDTTPQSHEPQSSPAHPETPDQRSWKHNNTSANLILRVRVHTYACVFLTAGFHSGLQLPAVVHRGWYPALWSQPSHQPLLPPLCPPLPAGAVCPPQHTKSLEDPGT